jgi:hypothetical protein
MKKNIYRRLEELERIQAAAVRAKAQYAEPSSADVARELMSKFGVEPLPGESQAGALARAAGISNLELKDLLRARANPPADF